MRDVRMNLWIGLAAGAVLGGCGAPIDDGGEPAEEGKPAIPRRAIYPKGTPRMDSEIRPTATRGAHLDYYGGPIIATPKVVTVLWGNSVASRVKDEMPGFFEAVLKSPHVDWLSEYDTNIKAIDGSNGTNQHFARGSHQGVYTITPSKTGPLQDRDISAELARQVAAGKLPAPDGDTLYMNYFAPGVRIYLGGDASCSTFCAYHNSANQGGKTYYYGVMPDMSPGSACSGGCGGNADWFKNLTSVTSHELIEAMTDAAVGDGGQLAWYDERNSGEGEIGDICNAEQGVVPGTSYIVQKEWSNQAGACIVSRSTTPPPPPPPPPVGDDLVTNGGFESGTSSWTLAGNAYSSTGPYPHSGRGYVVLGFYDNASGSIEQTVALPAGKAPKLSFWLNVSTSDEPDQVYDTLKVEVRDMGGAVLGTLATFSNQDSAAVGAYGQRASYDLSAWAGRTVRVRFNAKNDPGLPSAFRLDDISIK